MNRPPVFDPAAPASSPMKAMAPWWRTLRFGWREAAWALFVGAATIVANGAPFGNNAFESGVFVPLAYNVLQFGVPAVLAVQVADAWVDRSPHQLWRMLLAYGLVALFTAVVGVWVVARLLWPVLGKEEWWGPVEDRVLAAQVLGWHLLGMTVYVQRRVQQRSQRRLAALAERQQQQQRELAAARLLALQARVDPTLLFERLQRIDEELAQDPERARAHLAALIDLLRALQPHHEARVSTLGRELDTARAFARLMGRSGTHSERLLVPELRPAMAEQPFAPAVLLPLLRPLLEVPGTLWQIAPGKDGAWRVQALGPDAESTLHAAGRVDLAPLHERLQAVHGPDARIELVADPLPAFVLRWTPKP